MRVCENIEVKIWLGLREGYTENYFSEWEVNDLIQQYCNAKKQCVTVTPTRFIYVDGSEPGVIVGFINYPRFPYSTQEVIDRALELGELLRKEFKQFRVSVSTPETTYLLEDEEN